MSYRRLAYAHKSPSAARSSRPIRGYRHDAALELMMGTMRPTTNMRMTMPYFSRYPDLFRYKYPVFPYPGMGDGSSGMNMNMFWNTSLIAY